MPNFERHVHVSGEMGHLLPENALDTEIARSRATGLQSQGMEKCSCGRDVKVCVLVRYRIYVKYSLHSFTDYTD